jgi:hypothetical protein
MFRKGSQPLGRCGDLSDLIEDPTKLGVGGKAKSSISAHEGEPTISII